MKKSLFLFALLVLLFLSQCNTTTNKKSKPVIGADLPLTGKMAFYGNEIKNSLQLLLAGDSMSFTLAIEDNQSNPSSAIAAFNKLSLNPDMHIVISSNSPTSLPLRQLALKKKINLLALVTGAKDFSLENVWCFRDAITPEQSGATLGKFILSKNLSNGAVYHINDDYGLSVSNSFRKNVNGITLKTETFSKDELDFRKSLTKLVDKRTEFILLVGREQSLITAINQIREINKTTIIITTDAFSSPTVLGALKNTLDNIYFVNYMNDVNNPQSIKFLVEYEKRYGSKPSVYAIDAYTAGCYLNNVLRDAPNNADSINLHLKNMRYHSSFKGDVAMNDSRDVLSPVGVYYFNKGSLLLVK